MEVRRGALSCPAARRSARMARRVLVWGGRFIEVAEHAASPLETIRKHSLHGLSPALLTAGGAQSVTHAFDSPLSDEALGCPAKRRPQVLRGRAVGGLRALS